MIPTSKPPFYQQLSLTLISLTIICYAIFIGQDILVPLVFSILLAILLLPVTNFLERKKLPRAIANIIGILLAFLFIGGIVYFLSSQISGFMQDLPSIKQHLADHWKTVQKWISQNFNFTRKEQTNFMDNAADKIKSSGTGILGDTVVSLTQALLVLVLMPVYTFLVLYYRDMIKKFLVGVFKNEHEAKVLEVLRESRSIVQGYMVGLIIEMGIVAAINSAGFLILGIQYAVFLGVLAAILNMIPYIGMLIASVFCMLITLTSSTEITDILGVLVILIVVQFIDNNIIMPKVVSSKVKINALITILGVLVGGALAGISGMFISIPAIAILKVIFDRVEDLKPWGLLLGDEITGAKRSKIYMKLGRLSNKLRPAAPLKPPTLD
ncbi:MAG: AI-2E family transporter [Ferruginibacter sp.]|nr:AI-2E family transporter [Ferruginibacter sp.]